jgi:hypothetical protein
VNYDDVVNLDPKAYAEEAATGSGLRAASGIAAMTGSKS